MVLVNGFDAWLETPHGIIPLTAQRYAPDVVSDEGRVTLTAFEPQPWPKWTYSTEGGYEAEMEVQTLWLNALANRAMRAMSCIARGLITRGPCGCPFQAWSLGEFLRVEARLA